MKKTFILFAGIALSIIFFNACTPKQKYERLLKKELASGIRYDSIFLGIYLGMPEKDFYRQCWDLNKLGLVKQGSTNTTVEYSTRGELKHEALMNFYPQFHDGKISEMPVLVKYKAWTPWNKEFSADNLQLDILNWCEKKYGKGYFEVAHPVHGKAFVKLNGNRRITIFKAEDGVHIMIYYVDMLVNKGMWSSSSDTTGIKQDTTRKK